jgi:hypothetical protein
MLPVAFAMPFKVDAAVGVVTDPLVGPHKKRICPPDNVLGLKVPRKVPLVLVIPLMTLSVVGAGGAACGAPWLYQFDTVVLAPAERQL